jgi:hypothetical protein
MRPVSSTTLQSSLPSSMVKRERLFAVDVDAGLASGDIDGGVPVVGRGVGHDVDALVVEQLPIVLIDGRLTAESLLGFLGMRQIDVADGHDFAELGRQTGDVRALPSDANQADVRAIVFRLCFVGNRGLAGKPIGSNHAGGGRGSSRANELSTVGSQSRHGGLRWHWWEQNGNAANELAD